MNRIHNCSHNFYLHVAKLFYAMASIDGQTRDEEYKTLKETLHKEWKNNYKGKQPIVDEILNCFQSIHKEKNSSEDSFQEFVVYKEKHERFFTNQIRKTLWEVCCSIADAVNKKNKHELIMLVYVGKSLGFVK